MRKFTFLVLYFFLTVPVLTFAQSLTGEFETVRTFQTKKAHQGVAVDKQCVYTINTKGIGKYDKQSGAFISEWNDTTGKIIHFDGAVVVGRKIYCAHSNYPGVPMTGSIEIFDKNTLKHVGSQSFGTKYGSCTWADFYNGYWWVCFGHYDRFTAETGTDVRWTTLVRFDRNWNETASWVFPKNLIAEFKPMSNSGGSWGPDGNLYVTGHDSTKVYLLQIPEMGSILRYVGTLKVDFNGQGIAWDRSRKGRLYGIMRKKDLVVEEQLSLR